MVSRVAWHLSKHPQKFEKQYFKEHRAVVIEIKRAEAERAKAHKKGGDALRQVCSGQMPCAVPRTTHVLTSHARHSVLRRWSVQAQAMSADRVVEMEMLRQSKLREVGATPRLDRRFAVCG